MYRNKLIKYIEGYHQCSITCTVGSYGNVQVEGGLYVIYSHVLHNSTGLVVMYYLPVLHKLPFVDRSIRPRILSCPMELVITELAFVSRATLVLLSAPSIHLILHPLPFIHCTVWWPVPAFSTALQSATVQWNVFSFCAHFDWSIMYWHVDKGVFATPLVHILIGRLCIDMSIKVYLLHL